MNLPLSSHIQLAFTQALLTVLAGESWMLEWVRIPSSCGHVYVDYGVDAQIQKLSRYMLTEPKL